VLDKNREISPLETEEGYGGKGSGEKVSFKTRKTRACRLVL